MTGMTDDFETHLKQMMAETAVTRMPFGKFGPEHCPPQGRLVYTLPYSYLAYFERQGYPAGKLGRVMKFVHDIKRDGAEAIFTPLRGGR
jgi:uncharacterized protein (DUF3820 family)